jgi:hypothetical protein
MGAEPAEEKGRLKLVSRGLAAHGFRDVEKMNVISTRRKKTGSLNFGSGSV